jgi:hypothetical protein
VKAFLDTSVLVPVFYGDHVHHAASLDLFARFDQKDVCCGAHSLLEVYSTLTRMPGKHRISSEQGMLFITNIRERMTIVSLSADEYGGHAPKIHLHRHCGRDHLRRLPGHLRSQGKGGNALYLEHTPLWAIRSGRDGNSKDALMITSGEQAKSARTGSRIFIFSLLPNPVKIGIRSQEDGSVQDGRGGNQWPFDSVLG